MKIYLDFDGTVVEHFYPQMGRVNFGCLEVIRRLQDAGHEIILNTYRVEFKNGTLAASLEFLNTHAWAYLKPDTPKDFYPHPIEKHTETKLHPWPWDWDVMHMEGIIMIDDVAAGIPLKPAVMLPGQMVDWDVLNLEFDAHGIYSLVKNEQ